MIAQQMKTKSSYETKALQSLDLRVRFPLALAFYAGDAVVSLAVHENKLYRSSARSSLKL